MSPKGKRKKHKRQAKRRRKEEEAKKEMPPVDSQAAPKAVENANEAANGQRIATNAERHDPPKPSWIVSALKLLWRGLLHPSRRALLYAEIFFAAMIAVFTLAQVIVGRWQWDATDKQWRSMEKQLQLMQLDQRPWITFDGPFVGHFHPGAPVLCTSIMENRGKTGARVIRWFLKTTIVPAGEDPDIDCEMNQTPVDGLEPLFTIAPGAKQGISLRRPPELSAAQIQRLADEDDVFYVYGRVDYLDAQGFRHKTRIFAAFNQWSENMTGQDKYNDAD